MTITKMYPWRDDPPQPKQIEMCQRLGVRMDSGETKGSLHDKIGEHLSFVAMKQRMEKFYDTLTH